VFKRDTSAVKTYAESLIRITDLWYIKARDDELSIFVTMHTVRIALQVSSRVVSPGW
jgi:hypothetical protein